MLGPLKGGFFLTHTVEFWLHLSGMVVLGRNYLLTFSLIHHQVAPP